MEGKIIIFSAPSGAGKSTIINYLMQQDLNLHFSVSATSRKKREGEIEGKSYFFMSPEEFRNEIANDSFVEYEQVYTDCYYGTLKRQIEAQLASGENIVLDVDVNGGLNVKKIYGDRALNVFVHPGSIEELRRRLVARGTESMDIINMRLERAEYELQKAEEYDCVIINDDLSKAQAEALSILKSFIEIKQ